MSRRRESGVAKLLIMVEPQTKKSRLSGILEVLFLGLPPSAGLKQPLRIDRR